jgi:hypothetical protein
MVFLLFSFCTIVAPGSVFHFKKRVTKT